MKRVAIVSLLALFAVGCQDAGIPTGAQPGLPVFLISDGATEGNLDFWFLPPVADNPDGNPEFEPAEFNPNLTPVVRICPEGDLNGVDEDRCPETALNGNAALDENHYHFDWKTAKGASGVYRVEVVLGTIRLGFFDAELSRKGTSADNGNVPVKAGSNIPVKFSIENNAVCIALAQLRGKEFDPTKPCATASLAAGESLTLQKDDQDAAIASVDDAATINLELCADLRDRTERPSISDGLVDIPTFGPCIEIENLEAFVVAGTATVCDAFDEAIAAGLSSEQAERMTVHRFGDSDDAAVALPHVDAAICDQLGQIEPNGLELLALRVRKTLRNTWQAARDQVVAWVGPRPLLASASLCNKGGCGGSSDFESSFQAALPSWMEHHGEDGDLGNHLVGGEPVTGRIKVWDSGEFESEGSPDPTPVNNVRLTVTVTGGTGTVSDGTGPFSDQVTIFSGPDEGTEEDGIAKFQLQVGPGTNTIEVTGIGVGTAEPEDEDPVDNVFAPSINGGAEVDLGEGTLEFTAVGNLFAEDFEDDLSQWVGKAEDEGEHNGEIVDDPLREGNQVLTFTALNSAGDIFGSEVTVMEGERHVLTFEYLGVPDPNCEDEVCGELGDLGGVIGFSEDTPGDHRWLAGTRTGSGIEADLLVDDGQWHTYSIEFDVFDTGQPNQLVTFTTADPPIDNTIRVMLEDFVGSAGVAGDVFFDNIQLTLAPPEP